MDLKSSLLQEEHSIFDEHFARVDAVLMLHCAIVRSSISLCAVTHTQSSSTAYSYPAITTEHVGAAVRWF